jgi:hypothetical protein
MTASDELEKLSKRLRLCILFQEVDAAPGGLMVSVFATGPTGLSVAGSGPAEEGGFLWAARTSFGGKIKLSVPCRRFTARKETCKAWVRCFVGQISRPLFLTRDSPASLLDGSDCWVSMIRMRVLGLQTSHVLLKCTNLGYGTVLTAAYARQGCSAGGLIFSKSGRLKMKCWRQYINQREMK